LPPEQLGKEHPFETTLPPTSEHVFASVHQSEQFTLAREAVVWGGAVRVTTDEATVAIVKTINVATTTIVAISPR
jgi:hypothetical protein